MGRKVGRPTTFNQAMADLICVQIAEGKSLRSICGRNDIPAKSVVMQWLNKQPQFADQYAHARLVQADVFVDMIGELSTHAATLVASGKAGKLDASLIRVAIDGFDKMAKLVSPKKYGALLKIGDPDGNTMETAGKIAIEEMQAQLDRLVGSCDDSNGK